MARALVAPPLFFSILVYLVNPDWMVWSSVALADSARWVGAGVGLLTVPLSFWVLRSIGSNISETVLTKERHELVTNEPYRWVRHLLYTSFLIMLISIGVMATNAFILAMAVLALVLILLTVIPREEANLFQNFPEEYASYRRGTGRLFPRSIRGAI